MSGSAHTPTKPHRTTRGLRLAVGVFLAIATALGIVWGIERWQSWPLRQGETALAAGDPARAEAFAGFYLEGHPADQRGLSLQARALVALGRGQEAVAIYEEIGAASADDVHAWAAAYLLTESW